MDNMLAATVKSKGESRNCAEPAYADAPVEKINQLKCTTSTQKKKRILPAPSSTWLRAAKERTSLNGLFKAKTFKSLLKPHSKKKRRTKYNCKAESH